MPAGSVKIGSPHPAKTRGGIARQAVTFRAIVSRSRALAARPPTTDLTATCMRKYRFQILITNRGSRACDI